MRYGRPKPPIGWHRLYGPRRSLWYKFIYWIKRAVWNVKCFVWAITEKEDKTPGSITEWLE